MNTLKITTILLTICIFIFENTKGQTIQWDEYYTETILYDQFTGNQLDNSKWRVENNFKRDIGLLKDTSATLQLNNNNLNLTMISCPNCKTASFQGNYAGAEVVSKQLFQYGIFECRVKFAQENGSWPAFWLIGGDGTPCPPGGYGNEIDMFEYFCRTSGDQMEHNVHHYHPPSVCDVSVFHTVYHKEYSYNGSNNYHNLKCIWTPAKISFYLDGILKYSYINTGQICSTGKKVFPENELYLVLSQQITNSSPVVPQTTNFDCVSVKRFFATPEITCPKSICTSDTAFLDVDSLATNVTWRISQPSLFTGPTMGSGKIIPINIAPGASGEGTIIFKFKMPSGEYFTATKTFWVGATKPDDFYITAVDNSGSSIGPSNGPFQVCPNNYYTFYLYPSYNLPTSHHQYGITDTDFFFDFNYQIISEGYGWAYVRVIDIDGDSHVVVYADTECSGYGELKDASVNEGYCGYYLLFTPNPAIDETTMSIVSYSSDVVLDENIEWELEIYDSFQSLKEKKTNLKGKEHIIQTAGWKEGVYIVRVKYNNEILQGKLMVKK